MPPAERPPKTSMRCESIIVPVAISRPGGAVPPTSTRAHSLDRVLNTHTSPKFLREHPILRLGAPLMPRMLFMPLTLL